MLDLIYQLIWRMCMIVTIAFLITRLNLFRQMIYQRLSWKGKIVMIFVFGSFGVIGNYTGIVIHPDVSNVSFNRLEENIGSFKAIADTRNIGVILGGLFGGPAVGLGAGMIAGGHRYFLGGFISTATLLLTVFGGLIAGLINRKIAYKKEIQPSFILMISTLILSIEIILIPLFTESYEVAVLLIKLTGLPIIIVNSIGIWICALIFYNVLREEEKVKALQTQKALFIANKTLPFFRQGLDEYSCEKVARILCTYTNADSVAITDLNKVLAHIGKGKEYDHLLQVHDQEAMRHVLQTGEIFILKSMPEFDHIPFKWPLKAVIIIPLLIREKPVGTLKLYYTRSYKFNDAEKELAEGLIMLLSTQLEIGEAERHKVLLQNAEIKALQAQIHPHFLFNSLNVIAALCKRDPLFARKLLIQLSTFLRNNTSMTRQTLIPIEKEMETVLAYFSLEQARFPERFFLETKIDPSIETALIPPFTIQPLVENAIVHGFSERCENETVQITIVNEEGFLNISIKDNGVGISSERLKLLGSKEIISNKGTGIAIQNIKERLSLVFGPEALFSIKSQVNKGTDITIVIPLQYERGVQLSDNSLLS
ncbi:LytS/YhcK type 5TM receptor domain-containing protein [Metabacillus fastidiosus]|uniref:histidine kinase n=1 Tax=Metabacillus fastidiosus TaxID=1458 RepID=A0ABU6NUA3_9BACI|nr:LytS/YhcK type 5TM receptor domain-containing protein [Metabacillus fastidiosus]MED4400480.1 LytS/YhcK type 5TM receptor domain-containing protein [Metabacillus fastidiosus]